MLVCCGRLRTTCCSTSTAISGNLSGSTPLRIERGRSSRTDLTHEVPVLSHLDWSSKHFRFGSGGEATVIYDWDSVARTGEMRALGRAVATHCYNWYIPAVRMVPAVEPMMAFIGDYEAARGRELTESERAIVSAQACANLAYIAKCKYSSNPIAAEESGEVALLRHHSDGRLF